MNKKEEEKCMHVWVGERMVTDTRFRVHLWTGIKEIEASMIEINQTMRDITMLVHEQGGMLGTRHVYYVLLV